VAWLLARVTVRRWAVVLGTSDGGLVATGAAMFSGLAVVGWLVADRWSPSGLVGSTGPAESVLLGMAVSIWALAAAFGIFAAHAAVVPPSLGFLRTLPVSPRQVDRATVLPLVVLVLAASVAAGPLTITVTTAATGRGPAHAGVLLGLVAIAGTALGTALHRAAARLLVNPGWGSLRLTAAYLGWCVAVAASVVAPLPLLRWLGPSVGLAVLAPLGWPLAWWALIDPQPVVAAGALAVTVALVVIGARVRRAPGDVTRGRSSVRPLVIWRPVPVARMQARRLVRQPRVLEALVVAGFFGVVATLGAAWLARRLPGALSPTVVALLGAQISAAPAALARGLSDRRRPAEAALGIGADAHVVALVGASLGLCAVAATPALVIAFLLLPASVGAGWLAALPVLVAVGVVVSVALTPELGNGSAEGGAVLAYAVASTAVLAGVDRLAPVEVAVAAGLLTLAAIAAAVTLERLHRRPT